MAKKIIKVSKAKKVIEVKEEPIIVKEVAKIEEEKQVKERPTIGDKVLKDWTIT